MEIDRIDHVVLTVRNLDATCAFYSRVFGMTPVTFGNGRRALAFGRQKFNLHEAGHEFEPKAGNPTPGAIDLCLVAATPLSEVIAHLHACGVPVVEGPVARTGALGPIRSVYVRDPDGNLVEISEYPANQAAPRFDPERFKQRTRAQWESAAAGWNACAPQIRHWLADATKAMLDAAAIGRGSRVLDLAAGAGDQTLAIAERVGSEGSVLASDISPTILAFAAKNARNAGYSNVETRVADGESLAVDESAFDATVCRLGLMLFPEPAAGVAVMHRALRDGGRACALVFSLPEANGAIVTAIRTALEHAGKPPQDPYAPGMLFSLAKPGVIEELFRRTGFREVSTTKIDAPFRLPSARDYVAFIGASAGPIRDLIGKLEHAEAEAAWADMEKRLKVFETAAGWVGPNELLLTAATR